MSQYYEIKTSAAMSDVLFVYISCLTILANQSVVFCVFFREASAGSLLSKDYFFPCLVLVSSEVDYNTCMIRLDLFIYVSCMDVMSNI